MNSNERYNRQIMLEEIGEAGQRKLSEARVLIVGVGGLGSPIATYLAGAGVGTIGLIDNDVVSISNLQRQVLYQESQVGLSKVECARERLVALNSSITVNTYQCMLSEDNADSIISEYDIVVDGTDNFDARYIISDVCHDQQKPYVYGAINALEGQVAILCKGRVTYRDLYPQPTTEKLGKAVVGITPGIVGTVEASQTLQLICGYGESLIDRLWTIDLRNLQSYIVDL